MMTESETDLHNVRASDMHFAPASHSSSALHSHSHPRPQAHESFRRHHHHHHHHFIRPTVHDEPLQELDGQGGHETEGGPSELRYRNGHDVTEERTIILEERSGNDDPYITQIVQTISIYHIIDPAGSPVATSTATGKPATVLIDPSTGTTITLSVPSIGASTAVGPASYPSTQRPAAAPTPSPSTPWSSLASSLSPLTSPHLSHPSSSPRPLSTVPAYPTLSGVHNATNPFPAGNASFVPASNGTSFHINVLTPSAARSSEVYSARSSVLPTVSGSRLSAAAGTHVPSSTLPVSSDLGGYGTASAVSSPSTSAPSSPHSGSALSQQTKSAVIGGVVGSVALVAIVAFFLMLLLRYKRKGGSFAWPWHALGRASGARRMDDGGGGMAQRGSGVAAALASLTGKHSAPASPPGPEERGFYRVSGRKLAPVLASGGDGYTDPRGSAASGESDYYRGSQAFEPNNGPSTRLALGSPMRPVSGVPVMRAGPGRTPVTEANPFADPPPAHDAGRPNTSRRDVATRGPASRFQEEGL